MSHMSYCRFENTYIDLYECSQHLDEKPASDMEENFREALIDLCRFIAEEYAEDKKPA